jgi:DNA-binding transcriptional regulator PaaX
MSMNSKVSPVLRSQIMNILGEDGLEASNTYIEFRLNFSYSLRAIQEATQKMAKEGTLSAIKASGKTFYTLTNPAAVNEAAQGATASN